MNGPARFFTRSCGALRLAVTAITLLAMAQMLPAQAQAQDGGSATITVNSFLEDGSTPLPFVRFQITDSNGTVYGPLETAPPNGSVSFTLDTVDDATTFEIVAETPPACAIQPDPVTVGPLADGDEESVDFSFNFLSDCDLGSISVYSYSCSDGIEPSATDYAIFTTGCTETVNDKTFHVSDESGNEWDLVTGAYGIAGRAPLIGLVPGAYQIEDTDPASDTETVVFCLSYPVVPDGSSDPDSVAQAEVNDDAISLSLNGERVACDFFAIPASDDDEQQADEEPTEESQDEDQPVDEGDDADEGNDGEVIEGDDNDAFLEVHLSACPAGYEGADFFNDCHPNGIEGQTITIEGPDDFTDSMETFIPESPGSGVAAFENLAAGEYKVSEDVPGDTATYYAFCSMADSDEIVDFEYDDSTSEAIRLTLGESEGVVCDFYIVPDEQVEEPTEEPTDEPTEEPTLELDEGDDDDDDQVEEGSVDDATLEVHLVECPAGYEGDAFFEDCHDNGIESQTVTLEGPDDFSDSMETTLPATPGPGVAAFEGLASGDYKVSQDASVDTDTYYAYCSMADSDEVVDFEYDDSTSEAIVLNLGESEAVVCDFYIVPNEEVDEPTEEPTEEPDEGDDDDDVEEGGADDATLEVHLSACPAGYGGGNFFEDCHDNGIEGQTITIEGPDDFTDSMQTILPASPGPGVAAFEGLVEGEYKVSEDVPGDTATYYAYCSMADSTEVVDFEYDDSTSEAIVLFIPESADIVCDFYIVPDPQFETGEILITKYTCPAGYESDAINLLLTDCPDKTEGVTFTLSPHSGGGDVDKTTSESGRVRFADLAPGNYDVSEDVPGEFSTPVVWCNVAGGEWYQKQISGSDTTTFDVDAGDDIRCAWFNLPLDLSGGGSLTIHKSICPDGLTSGYFATCYDDTLSDVTFVANGPGGFEESQTTGDNGIVEFTELNAGTYTITELPPSNVNVAVYVVVCTRDGQTYNFTYDDSTGLRINIKIPAGGEIVCDWYNVPPAKPKPGAEGSITVIKYLCQGKSNNKYDWEDDCESYGAGAEFELTRISNGAITEGVTPANGQLVFANLADGNYALDETSGDWCHAEADHVDASGNVRVIDGGNTNVYIYNCDKPVDRLPSTGIGPSGQPGGIGGTMLLWSPASLIGLFLLRRIRQQRPAPAVIRRAA